jgi:hypothetical protein
MKAGFVGALMLRVVACRSVVGATQICVTRTSNRSISYKPNILEGIQGWRFLEMTPMTCSLCTNFKGPIHRALRNVGRG